MIFETVMNISRELERKTAIEVTVKLMEEVGEMSQALLSSLDVCGCGYKGFTREDVVEEIADIVICALSIAQKMNATEEELTSEILRKIKKWEAKCEQI